MIITTTEVCEYRQVAGTTVITTTAEPAAARMAATVARPVRITGTGKVATGKSVMYGYGSPVIGNLYGTGVETMSAYGNQDTTVASPRKSGYPTITMVAMATIVIKSNAP